MKKILSILLVVLMLVGMLPINAMHVHAAESSVTLDLSNKSNRTVFTTSQQIWAQNGITVTNNKSSSTTNVADYAPPRFYASSELIFECSLGNITKIEVFCNSSSYASNLATSAKNSGATASSSSTTTTITLDGSSNTFTISKLSAQVRAGNKVTVYYEEAAAACQHTNTTTTTVDATCTEAGSTTVTCNDCGAEVSKTAIDATGHNYVGGVCQNCGAKLYTVSFSVPAQVGSVDSITANESGVVTLPEADDYSVAAGAKHDYTFFGWIEQSLSADQTDVPVVHKAGDSFKPSDNVTLSAVYTYSVAGGGTAGYTKTELSAIEATDRVVIVATKTDSNAGNYAMSNNNGTGSAPAAVAVTVDGNAVTASSFDNIVWNIEKSGENYIIYPDGTTATWLYCTSTNNGVRVGTNTNKLFTLDSSSGYLKHVATGRYLGVYLAQDWRCYTTSTTTNIANQTFAFYVEGEGDTAWYTSTLESADTTCQHTNTTSTTTDPSCTVAGKTTVTCADCGAFISETEIPAPGHTEVVDEAVAPTCVDTGLTEGSHCSVCDTVIKEQETVAATGEHIYVDGTCSVCGAEKPTGGSTAWQLVTDVDEIKAGGQFVIVGYDSAANAYYALPTTIASKMAGVSVTVADNKVVSTVGNDILWTVETCGDGIAIYNGTAYLKYASSTNLGNAGTTPYEFTLEALGDAFKVMASANTSRGLVFRGKSEIKFGGYAMSNVTGISTEYFGIQFYKMVTLCNHETVEDVAAVAPTCEEVGYTAGVYCTDCEKYIEGHEEVAALGHTSVVDEAKAPTCTETGLTEGSHCSVCNIVLVVQKEVAALGHTSVVDEAKAPTCTETGLTEGSHCSVCDKVLVEQEEVDALGHSYDEGVTTKPTITEDGYITYTCTVCGHSYQETIPAIGPLKFSTATLTLTQNLSINFRVNSELLSEDAYTNAYAVFKFGYEELTVSDYALVNGKYQFTCYNISPNQMTETVSATLYAYFDGELIEGETMTYSVGQYCLALLGSTDDVMLHTLIVDMLYYGDEASKYTNYRTEVPATSILTEEQKELHTTAVPSLENVLAKPVRVDNAKASWKAVTLVLDDTVEIRYRLAAESIDGLTAKITADGNSWTVDAFTPVPGEDGQYYVKFDQLSAAMMRETVLITIYEGSTAVSDTLSYSVESYAYAQQNNAKLSNLVLEMMRYGDSVYSYFTKEDV